MTEIRDDELILKIVPLFYNLSNFEKHLPSLLKKYKGQLDCPKEANGFSLRITGNLRWSSELWGFLEKCNNYRSG